MLDFRPPLDSPALIGAMKLVLPLYMKMALHGTRVEVVPGAVERFQKVAGKRGMICPNHSNRHDPQVMFALAKILGEDVNFVAAREVFDWDHGRNGWWLQHLGCFSVVRGAPDRESFKTSRRIIAEGKKKLVLFPEGEISRQNDTLMPLESGAAQLCFWAVDELAKSHTETHGANDKANDKKNEPVYIIPVALKYTYAGDVRISMMKTLNLLEAETGITPGAGDSLYTRLRHVAVQLLITLEAEYGVKPSDDQTVDQRINNLRNYILQSAAQQLHITLPEGEPQLSQVRILHNAIDDFVYSDDQPKSDYQKKIHEQKVAMVRGLYKDLDRVVNFIVIYENYFRERNTQERFSDMLERLESEIIGGDPSIKGERVVYANVGEPIDMTALYPEYKTAKKKVLQAVTSNLETQLTTMLAELEKRRIPMSIDATEV